VPGGKSPIVKVHVAIKAKIRRAVRNGTYDVNRWLVDSGATDAITSNPSLFLPDSLEQLCPPLAVEGLTGPVTHATHKGRISVGDSTSNLNFEFPALLVDLPTPNIFASATDILVERGATVCLKGCLCTILQRMPRLARDRRASDSWQRVRQPLDHQ